MTAVSASLATAEVLACIGDPSVWRGEIEAFTETLYREIYGDLDDVVDVPDVADDVEAACPVCRPGAVVDGARPVRCILHGGDDPSSQPTNASVCGFRLDASEDAPAALVGGPDRAVYLPAGAGAAGMSGRYNAALREGRNLFIVMYLAEFAECGLPVTAQNGRQSLARAMAEALNMHERVIREGLEVEPTRSRQFNELLRAALRWPECMIKRPRADPAIALGVRYAQCGRAGKVPKHQVHVSRSRLCTDCCEL